MVEDHYLRVGGGKSQDVQTKWEENKKAEIKSDGEKNINY